MTSAPHMPLFCGDYIADTTHLSMEQSGSYLQILMVTWRNRGKALPDDDTYLARICRVSVKRFRERIRPAIAPFFDLSRGTWRNARLEKEWKWVAKRAEIARRNGASGGRPSPNSPDDPDQNGFQKDEKHSRENESGSNATETDKPLKYNGTENPTGSSRDTQRQTTHPHTQSKKESEGGGGGARALTHPYTRTREGVAAEIALITGMEPARVDLDHVQKWLDAGYDPEREIFPAIREAAPQARDPIGSIRYFDKPIARRAADLRSPLPTVEARSPAPNVHHFPRSKPLDYGHARILRRRDEEQAKADRFGDPS